MEAIMTNSKKQIRETETNELSEAELSQVSAGIIAVRQAAQMCDGSVKPVAPQAEKALIGLL
jgi:hypothetical protein